MRPLATPRLALEPLVEAHAAEMFAALSDEATYRYIDEEAPESVERLAQRYRRLESRRSADGTEHWLNWVARESSSGAAIGYVQATVQPDGTAIVAYVIAPSRWGHGFGREATGAMIAEVIATYGAKRLVATVDEANAASIRLLQALGFEDRGRREGDRVYERRA